MKWFDSHLDLAHLALEGRDMLLESVPHTSTSSERGTVTLPTLAAGQVRWAFATIFTGADYKGSGGYPRGDAEAAFQTAKDQLEIYDDWERAGLVKIVRTASDLDDESDSLKIILLIEGADPILDPDHAGWWHGRGARVLGLTWTSGTRYAGGDSTPAPLTDMGRRLVEHLDELGIVHDLSHLCHEAANQLLESSNGLVAASHSNSAALVDPGDQRHLSDELIRAIGDRGGIVGLNLYGGFIDKSVKRPSLDATVAHVLHASEVMGRRDRLGLGSDMDGGFGIDEMPEGIDSPSDLVRLAELLTAAGWSADEVAGFASENWLGFMRSALS